MQLDEAQALLARTPVFSHLPASAVGALAEAGSVVEIATGEALVREGEPADALFVVVSGTLRAEVRTETGPLTIGRIGPGDLIGESAIVGYERRTASVLARTDTRVFRLGRDAIDALLMGRPEIVESIATVLHQRLLASRLRAMLEDVLPDEGAEEMVRRAEWVEVPRGETVFVDGDPSDSWYIVVDGWFGDFRADRRDRAPTLTEELRRGDAFGELELVLDLPRSRSIRALRDSTVVRFTRDDFHELTHRWPQLLMSITRRLFARLAPRHTARRPTYAIKFALVPVHAEVDIEAFGVALEAAFVRQGLRVLRATIARVEAETGLRGLSSRPSHDKVWARADMWFERAADRSDIVLVQAESRPSHWTQRAGVNADRVIAVAPGQTEIDAKFASAMLWQRGSKATMALSMDGEQSGEPVLVRRSLVMVHGGDAGAPSATRTWTDAVGADQVHHVRRDAGVDYDRVVRLLSGKALGLALGGGGARGFAHLGVYRALVEHGIPVDAIGGTSMGAIVASQIARGLSYDEMIGLNRECIAVKPFTEYTVPMVALLKSRGIEAVARMSGGKHEIEDLWLPFFAISADLSNARMVVHETGPVWRAIRASGSLPGIVLPVVEGQSLLVDGGIINNLPADVMRRRCGAGGVVIGVNVSPEKELAMKHEAFPAQTRLLFDALLRRKAPDIPSIINILMRSTVLSSINHLGASRSEMDLLLSPDIDAFGTLDFDHMDAIIDAGYRHAAERIPEIEAVLASAWARSALPAFGRDA